MDTRVTSVIGSDPMILGYCDELTILQSLGARSSELIAVRREHAGLQAAQLDAESREGHTLWIMENLSNELVRRAKAPIQLEE